MVFYSFLNRRRLVNKEVKVYLASPKYLVIQFFFVKVRVPQYDFADKQEQTNTELVSLRTFLHIQPFECTSPFLGCQTFALLISY